jgi:hypothetical protein
MQDTSLLDTVLIHRPISNPNLITGASTGGGLGGLSPGKVERYPPKQASV